MLRCSHHKREPPAYSDFHLTRPAHWRWFGSRFGLRAKSQLVEGQFGKMSGTMKERNMSMQSIFTGWMFWIHTISMQAHIASFQHCQQSIIDIRQWKIFYNGKIVTTYWQWWLKVPGPETVPNCRVLESLRQKVHQIRSCQPNHTHAHQRTQIIKSHLNQQNAAKECG